MSQHKPEGVPHAVSPRQGTRGFSVQVSVVIPIFCVALEQEYA